MPRALVLTPADGPHITLDDLQEFVAQARAKGIASGCPVRFYGALELNLTHGPRATRVTLIPGEEDEA